MTAALLALLALVGCALMGMYAAARLGQWPSSWPLASSIMYQSAAVLVQVIPTQWVADVWPRGPFMSIASMVHRTGQPVQVSLWATGMAAGGVLWVFGLVLITALAVKRREFPGWTHSSGAKKRRPDTKGIENRAVLPPIQRPTKTAPTGVTTQTGELAEARANKAQAREASTGTKQTTPDSNKAQAREAPIGTKQATPDPGLSILERTRLRKDDADGLSKGRWWPLYIDLVPKTAWFSNLRSMLKRSEWDKVKKKTSEKAQGRCEVCLGKGPKWPVECHERWAYDEQNRIQILIGTVALCPACHKATHMGLAQVKGWADEAMSHIAQVNGWDPAEAEAHARDAFTVWKARSRQPWTLDATWILSFVDLSSETQEKVWAYKEDTVEREVTNWQRDIINGRQTDA